MRCFPVQPALAEAWMAIAMAVRLDSRLQGVGQVSATVSEIDGHRIENSPGVTHSHGPHRHGVACCRNSEVNNTLPYDDCRDAASRYAR